jgi:uncharacterized protein YbaR (Trm112 family)
MVLELLDLLRCTTPHEDFPLVAAIRTRSDRDITAGLLGCPVCGAEYPIEDGIAIFGEGLPREPARVPEPYGETDEEAAMRCAAMLALFDPGGVVILGGAWGRCAPTLLEMTRTSLLLVEPPTDIRLGNGIGGIRVGTTIPLAASSARGIALDDRTSLPTLVVSAARALKPGGRLVASAAQAVPVGIVERARDDRHWVGEAEPAPSVPVQLTRVR